MAGLQFAPWSSDIELSFYAALASRKINHDKLDDAARKIIGRYEVRPNDAPERSARMQIHGNAITSDDIPAGSFRAEGTLKNVNTIEEYRALNRSGIIEQAANTIWEAIVDGTIYSCPSLLSSFYAIFFADLKKYKFTYHFCFPAIHSDPQWKMIAKTSASDTRLGAYESARLYEAVQTWKYSVDHRQHGFFLAKRQKLTHELEHDANNAHPEFTEATQQRHPSDTPTPQQEELDFKWIVGTLSQFENGFFADVDADDCFVSFVDPSTYPQNPGWMLRNLLVLVQRRWRLNRVQMLSYRDTQSRRDQANSIIMRLQCEQRAKEADGGEQLPKVTGWERNEQNKLNSRMVDLAEYMDPARLADQSVDLNLKLMKWRIAPDLDLDVVKRTKCLLLGAGTLGSYVSRNLLGWGVRHVTFVDNATVSFSNPVRQPLFKFDDCLGGGAQKAVRAAAALKEIYPGVQSTGYVLSVPMAGHAVTDEDKVKREYEQLRQLIDEHDAIFLLMDTRESRWLPTVMGKSAGKIVMNAALGFNSYVVMRHGGGGPAVATSPSPSTGVAAAAADSSAGPSLGCYFCNDVVAPADSLTDRTLDQQCTVTRPGVAAIASALLVELLISVLQHPLRASAPAPSSPPSSAAASAAAAAAAAATATAPRAFTHPLGLVPHQIRGTLHDFRNVLVQGPAYDCCSACSPAIVRAHEREGWAFVKRAIGEPGWIERVSGLDEVQRRAEAAASEMEREMMEEEQEEEGDQWGEAEIL